MYNCKACKMTTLFATSADICYDVEGKPINITSEDEVNADIKVPAPRVQLSKDQLPRFHDKNNHQFGRRHNLPLIQMSEISKHCDSSSCWIVVNDLVFDVTAYLPYHPASTRCIIKNSGGIDCERHFKFHSKNAQKLLNKFVIGRVQRENTVDCCIQ